MNIREFVGDNKALCLMFGRELLVGGNRLAREVIDECALTILSPRTLISIIDHIDKRHMCLIIQSDTAKAVLGQTADFALQPRSKQFTAACLLYIAAMKAGKTIDTI